MQTYIKKSFFLAAFASTLLISGSSSAIENSTDCNVLVIKAPQGATISADVKKTELANIIVGSTDNGNIVAIQRKGAFERGGGGYAFPMKTVVEIKKGDVAYKARISQTYCLFEAGAVTVTEDRSGTSGISSDVNTYREPAIKHPKIYESAGKVEFAS